MWRVNKKKKKNEKKTKGANCARKNRKCKAFVCVRVCVCGRQQEVLCQTLAITHSNRWRENGLAFIMKFEVKFYFINLPHHWRNLYFSFRVNVLVKFFQSTVLPRWYPLFAPLPLISRWLWSFWIATEQTVEAICVLKWYMHDMVALIISGVFCLRTTK